MAISKLHQSGDWDFIEPNATAEVQAKKIKAVRIDQSGEIIFTPEGSAAKTAGNYVQGEVLNIQGNVAITTDATARVQVFY